MRRKQGEKNIYSIKYLVNVNISKSLEGHRHPDSCCSKNTKQGHPKKPTLRYIRVRILKDKCKEV